MRLALIAACLIFVGFAAFQSSTGFFEQSSVVDERDCNLNSVDRFSVAAGAPQVGAAQLLRLELSECESGTLKSVYYDISGPSSEQIYNTEPIHELNYVFMNSGAYLVQANYRIELTNGSIVQRKLPLEVVIK